MNKNRRERFVFILLSVAAIAALLILASGVSTVELEHGGRVLPQLPQAPESPEMESSPPSPAVDTAFRVLFTLVGALLPFAVVFYLVAPEGRKRLLRDLIALLIIFLPLYLLWRAQPEMAASGGDFQLPQPPAEELPPAPDVAVAPEPRQWFVLALTIGTGFVLAALLVGLGWTIWQRRQRPTTSLDRLARQAQNAIDTLEAGGDLKDTVTRCYFEMMQVLKEERGVQRQRAMTPREFEASLEEVGIPTNQVRRLTRLFEDVRYGDKQLGQQEERQAVVSLTSIVRFCRSAS